MSWLRSKLEKFMRKRDLIVMNKDLTFEDFLNEFSNLDNIRTYEIGMFKPEDEFLIVRKEKQNNSSRTYKIKISDVEHELDTNRTYTPQAHIIINSKKYILGSLYPEAGEILCYYFNVKTVEGIIASFFYQMENLEYLNLRDEHESADRGHFFYCYDEQFPPPNLEKLELLFLTSIPLITTTKDLVLFDTRQTHYEGDPETQFLLDGLDAVDVLNFRNVKIDRLSETEVALKLASKMKAESLIIKEGTVRITEDDVNKIMGQIEKDKNTNNIDKYQELTKYQDEPYNPDGLLQIFDAVGAENFYDLLVESVKLYNGYVDVAAFMFIVYRNSV